MDAEVQEGDGTGDVGRPKGKRARYLRVRVVERRGESVVVERVMDDVPWRGVLPKDALRTDGRVAKPDLDAAIPYGVPWEEFDFRTPTARELCTALRKRGIWTYEDLTRRPQTARKAILSLVMGASWADIVRFAREATHG